MAAEVFALEPDAEMRSLLMLRVAEREHLRRRVTVLPDGVLEARLPPHPPGAVLTSVV
jgi:hypothetical protein